VQLLTGRDGAVHPYPLAEVPVHSATELLCFIRLACALRATEATGVHNQSSRSHAVCRIFIDRGGEKEGMLQLIDLAGSEHRIDSAEHDAARRKEGAQAIFEKYL
jgi:kinesin family protein 2/24